MWFRFTWVQNRKCSDHREILKIAVRKHQGEKWLQHSFSALHGRNNVLQSCMVEILVRLSLRYIKLSHSSLCHKSVISEMAVRYPSLTLYLSLICSVVKINVSRMSSIECSVDRRWLLFHLVKEVKYITSSPKLPPIPDFFLSYILCRTNI